MKLNDKHRPVEESRNLVLSALINAINKSNLNNPLDGATRSLIRHVLFKLHIIDCKDHSSDEMKKFIEVLEGKAGADCILIGCDPNGNVEIDHARHNIVGRLFELLIEDPQGLQTCPVRVNQACVNPIHHLGEVPAADSSNSDIDVVGD